MKENNKKDEAQNGEEKTDIPITEEQTEEIPEILPEESETEESPDGEKKDGEYEALYNKYLRVVAEYDNFRKRTAKEKEGIYTDAVCAVLTDLLPVLDNLERAVQFTESDKLAEGLKMIHSQFKASFAKIGVAEIAAEGESFNPEVHNAVMYEEDENMGENLVKEVLQKGYIRVDRVIRPAMVRVVN